MGEGQQAPCRTLSVYPRRTRGGGGGMSRDQAAVIGEDVRALHQLGYAQVLPRWMGGFTNFAVSFSTVSIITGTVALYDYGLTWGGPGTEGIGWPLVSLFTLAVAAALAELASAYPTA